MSEETIVQFDEYPMALGTLSNLPEEHVSVLAILSFAVSEVNALQRIFLSQSHDYIGDKVIDEVINVQKFVVLRTWSSKLFEVRAFLESLCGSKPKTSDKAIRKLAEEVLNDLDSADLRDGYQTARDIRNEMSSHYSLDAARKNLPHVHSDALCGMYIHEHSGNDFFPLGEAVMFHGRLHRKWSALRSIAERRAKLDLWLGWCLETNRRLIEVHAKFSDALLFRPLGSNRFFRKTYRVPRNLVGHPFDSLTPTIFRKREA